MMWHSTSWFISLYSYSRVPRGRWGRIVPGGNFKWGGGTGKEVAKTGQSQGKWHKSSNSRSSTKKSQQFCQRRRNGRRTSKEGEKLKILNFGKWLKKVIRNFAWRNVQCFSRKGGLSEHRPGRHCLLVTPLISYDWLRGICFIISAMTIWMNS